MYTLIFVDDESIVRDGMASKVPWQDHGFTLLGTFSNGQDAIDFLEVNPVDVVLSDISMPHMDGLKLSQTIALLYPQTTVLLLTGYDDFEYAQEAIKYGVKELLLKPITAKEIGQVLDTLKIGLEQKALLREQERIFKETLDTTLPLLRERFLLSLVLGYMKTGDVVRRKSFYRWTDYQQNYLIIVVAFLRTAALEDFDRLGVKLYLENLVENSGDVFLDRSEDLIILLQGEDKQNLEQQGFSIGQELIHSSSARNTSEFSLAIGIGSTVQSIDQLPNSYNDARAAADRVAIIGLSGIQSVKDKPRYRNISSEDFHFLVRTLLTDLREERPEQVMETLNKTFQILEQAGISKSEVEGYLVRLQFLLLDFFEELDENPEENKDQSILLELRVPKTFGNLLEAREFFNGVVNSLEHCIQKRRSAAFNSRIARAKEVIQQRFTEKKFSLQDICQELYLSTSQFSSLFKAGTGQTFVEYLTQTRIHQAKHLLKTTDLRSFEIAEKVGYEDPRYFSMNFKKHTGSTPQEYRKACGQ